MSGARSMIFSCGEAAVISSLHLSPSPRNTSSVFLARATEIWQVRKTSLGASFLPVVVNHLKQNRNHCSTRCSRCR